MVAHPVVVLLSRHHARQVLWDWGWKDCIEPVDLVVSELVTNAIRACGRPAEQQDVGASLPVVRLWLTSEQGGVLVLAWDANPGSPERREPGLDDDGGGGPGLLLAEMLSEAWGSFKVAGKPGKVV